MKTIHYADYDITTTDRIAHAILEYSKVLALRERSDTVHVPGVDGKGQQMGFDLLIGPASQIVVADVAPEADRSVDDEIDDDAVLAELGTRTRSLTSAEIHASDQVPVDEGFDYDYLGTDEEQSG